MAEGTPAPWWRAGRRVRSPWRAYAVFGVLVALAVQVGPPGPATDSLFVLSSAAAVLATAAGVRRHRPRGAGAWWLLVAGLGAWTLGDATYWLCWWVLDLRGFPGPPDVFYVAAYPLLTAALLRLARQARPARDVEGTIDAAILVVGCGLLSWTFLIAPTLAHAGADPLGAAVSAAYPVGDVLVLGALVRVVTAAGRHSVSSGLFASAALVMLLVDTLYQVATTSGSFDGSGIDWLWQASYVLWGCAALHPSMRRLSDPVPAPETAQFSTTRLLVLTGASLLAPATLVLQLLLGRPPQAWAVVVGSTVLFLLVVARLHALVRRVREQADQLAELARTDPLTGLLNRRSADAELRRLRERAELEGTDLVVGLLDLDRFKVFNDTFGHPAGDRLLVGAATAWRSALAGTGVALARWGGEEFAVLAAGVAPARVERLLADLRAVVPDGQTFSAGLARWDGTEPLEALVARADAALYAAKHAGRACTRTADPGAGPVRPAARRVRSCT
ncbi:GGDEF domain-containing protein [Kineococcus sp. LSe6-4]|uniref:GGDEF domain-containing protein n=1 Tax=Kineococcus halophytocola TaxID=3234027 RepID=A0ABV4GYC6_9ACTN